MPLHPESCDVVDASKTKNKIQIRIHQTQAYSGVTSYFVKYTEEGGVTSQTKGVPRTGTACYFKIRFRFGPDVVLFLNHTVHHAVEVFFP